MRPLLALSIMKLVEDDGMYEQCSDGGGKGLEEPTPQELY
jgi:hypothetical protein